MNILEAALVTLEEKNATPSAALIYCMLYLRGGKVPKRVLFKDADEWVAEHGMPTWRSLKEWAAASDIEADIARAVVNSDTAHGRFH